MARKIKPQRTQRDTESCYFSLSPPLCPPCSLWFSETLNRKYQKVSEVLVTVTQDTREPVVFHASILSDVLKSCAPFCMTAFKTPIQRISPAPAPSQKLTEQRRDNSAAADTQPSRLSLVTFPSVQHRW